MMLGSMVISSMHAQSKSSIAMWKMPFLQKCVASKIINLIRPTVPLMDCGLLPHLPLMQKHLKFSNWQYRSFSVDAAVALAYAIIHKDNIRLSLMLSQYVSYDKSADEFRWMGRKSSSRFHDASPREFMYFMIGDDAEYFIDIISNSTIRTHGLSTNWIEKRSFYPRELCHDEANMFMLGGYPRRVAMHGVCKGGS
jgi:hypothetical protein